MAKYNKARFNKFRNMGEYTTLGSGLSFKPKDKLKIEYFERDGVDASVVMRAGQFVSLNADGDIVPANGGVAKTFTYDALDEEEYDGVTSGDTIEIPANKPLGVLFKDSYARRYHTDPTYNVDTGLTIMTSGHGIWALPGTTDLTNYTPGTLVKLNADGWPEPITSTDVAAVYDAATLLSEREQIVGRIVKVLDANTDRDLLGGVQYTTPVPNVNLEGNYGNGLGEDGLGVMIAFDLR
jgi:hypothetical protein